MSLFVVSDNCIRCGLCAELCPTRIIQFTKGEKPFVPEDKENRCMACGQCVSFCPRSCCQLSFQPEEDRIPVYAHKMPSEESSETLLCSRRSIRRFKEEPVPEETLQKILRVTRYAPSATNSQPVRWIISPTRAKTMSLGQMVIDYFKTMENSEMGARYSGITKIWDAGTDIIFRGAPQLAVAVVNKNVAFPEDATIALTYFELAAHAYNVGCCWAGFFTRASRQDPTLQNALGVKENELIVGGQMFGLPALSHSRQLPPRKKLEITYL